MINERVAKVLELRLESTTIKDIAEELNFSETTISDDLKICYEKSSDIVKRKLDKIAYEIKSQYKDKKLEQTFELRLEKKSINEMSEILGCSPSTIRWRLREILKDNNESINSNLNEVSRLIGHKKKNRITFYDLTDYELGIFWGMGSYNEESNTVIFRETRKHFIEVMNEITENTFYDQNGTGGKNQYVLKSCLFDINSFIESGWTERNAKIRDIPELENYKDFLRGHIEMRSGFGYSLRYSRNKSNKRKSLLFRIYGNYKLIDSINNILSNEAGVGIKTPQKASNETTVTLIYASLKEIESICNWLRGDNQYSQEFWDKVDYHLSNPIQVVN